MGYSVLEHYGDKTITKVLFGRVSSLVLGAVLCQTE